MWFHQHCRHQQQIILFQNISIGLIDFTLKVLSLAIETIAILFLEKFSKEHADIHRVGKVVGPIPTLGHVLYQG